MMADDIPDFTTYAEFWPYYLGQHSKRATRRWHIAGTLLALACLGLAALTFNYVWFVLTPIFGYGVAWGAHALVEKNHPATFTYPLWSLRADLHMCALWVTGRLEQELTRQQIHG